MSNSRSLAQAYTHKVTLLQDFMSEKKGTAFCLFDDGKVFDDEIMTFRQPEKGVAVIVREFEAFPKLLKAVKNPQYHQHAYEEKSVFVCTCGAVKEDI